MTGGVLDPAGVVDALRRQGPFVTLYVAYSGGADSHALLYLLTRYRERLGCDLRAVHVNHNLQPGADSWVEHCRGVARELRIPLTVLDVYPDPDANREARARRARYQALTGLLGAGEAVCTAHHREDQAETVLLRLLRGSGVDGLAAMPASRPLGNGRLLRPLLEVSRDALRRYAAAHGLEHVDDPSNTGVEQDRNYLRNRVLPLLRCRWPAADSTLARYSAAAAEARRLGEDLAVLDGLPSGPQLDCALLWALPGRRRRNLVRAWLRSLALPLPGRERLLQGLDDLLHAEGDRVPEMRWPGGRVRRYRERLHADDGIDPPPLAAPRPWRGEPRLLLPSGVLHARPIIGDGLSRRVVSQGLVVDHRRPGERCRPAGRPRRTLKKLMQEAGIPPWQRDQWPVLRGGGETVAVPGICVCTGFRAEGAEEGVVLRFEPRS